MFTVSPFLRHLAVAGFALCFAARLQAQLTVTNLGYYSGYVSGVTNGGVVVGNGNMGAFRWTADEGLSLLGPASDGRSTYADAITSDGTTVVGSVSGGDQLAFRWSKSTGVQLLAPVPGYQNTISSDVSADGSKTVVTGYNPNTTEAETFVRSESGSHPIGHLPGNNSTWGKISNDGSVVAGSSKLVTSAGIQRAGGFRWTEAGGMEDLGFDPDTINNEINNISGDGSTIVGHIHDGVFNQTAVRWTADEGLIPLREMGTDLSSSAYAVSGDGSMIVGFVDSSVNFGDRTPFVWTPEIGMISLTDALIHQFGLHDLLGGSNIATAISDNGRYIAGYGQWFGGDYRGWVIDRGENAIAFEVPEIPVTPIPEPSTYGLMGVFGLAMATFVRRWRKVRHAASGRTEA
jgi:uncharacterized membrane protein